jgi:hypothetical protein
MTGRQFTVLFLTLFLVRGVMLATGYRFVDIPLIDPAERWIGAHINMLAMGIRGRMRGVGAP